MSNAAVPQQMDDAEWDYVLNQLDQQWAVRDEVSTVLKEANAAFAAQFTGPNARKYGEACEKLIKFLDRKIPMEHSEQKSVRVSHVWSCFFR